MHSLTNNPPKRIHAIHALVQNIALCGQEIDRIEQDADATNHALAFCEIAVSTPVTWYSDLERLMVSAIVERLYKRPLSVFCVDIMSNEISFYNKCADENTVNNTRDDVVRILHRRQAELMGEESHTDK